MLVPVALLIVEFVVAFATEPEWLLLRDLDDVEPWVAGSLVGQMEEDVNFFKRTVGRLGVEEVYERHNDEICGSKDDVRVVSDVVKGDWGYEDDTRFMLATITKQAVECVMGESIALNLHKVEQPVSTRTERVRGSSDPQWHYLHLVEPRHALPPDGKEGAEAEEEHGSRNPSCIYTMNFPQVYKNGQQNHTARHTGSTKHHQASSAPESIDSNNSDE